MTPAGIEPAAFRFVAQQLNHSATAVSIHFMSQRLFVFFKCEKMKGNGQGLWYMLERREAPIGFMARNLKEKGHVEDLGICGRIILKWI